LSVGLAGAGGRCAGRTEAQRPSVAFHHRAETVIAESALLLDAGEDVVDVTKKR